MLKLFHGLHWLFIDLIPVAGFRQIGLRPVVGDEWPVYTRLLIYKVNRPEPATRLLFNKGYVIVLNLMDSQWKYQACHIPISEFDIFSKCVLKCHLIKSQKFMLPRETLRITVGAGKYWNKYQTFQFPLKAFVYVMSFKQTIMRVRVKVY